MADISHQEDKIEICDLMSSEQLCKTTSQIRTPSDDGIIFDAHGECISGSFLNLTSPVSTDKMMTSPNLIPLYLDLETENSSYEANNSTLQQMNRINYDVLSNEIQNSEELLLGHSSFVNANLEKMTPLEVEDEYACINEYDYIHESNDPHSTGGRHGDTYTHSTGGHPGNTYTHIASSGQLTVKPDDIYEHLNANTRNFNNSNRSSRKNIKIPCLIVKITLSVVVLGIAVVLSVAITNGLKNTGQDLILDTHYVNETQKSQIHENASASPWYLTSLSHRCVVTLDKAITGISVLNNKLYVAQTGSSQVDVFNISSNFSLVHRITINGPAFFNQMNIAGSPRLNSLFLSGDSYPTPDLVYKYNATSNVISQCFQLSRNGWVRSMSLTSNDTIIFVTVDGSFKIKEYSPDGSLIRGIILDDSTGHPSYIIQVRSDQFLVSHSSGSRGATLHRVCLVNNNGTIVQCYGGLRGIGIGQLHFPCMLAVDRNDKLLVADEMNNRIVLLSPSLTYLGYIVMPNQLSSPTALFLDELNHQLYIGDITGRVFELTVG